MTKKKAIIIVLAIILVLILLIPAPMHLTDGGTVIYQAILYSITDYHYITDGGYMNGIKIEILGITIYKNTILEEQVMP